MELKLNVVFYEWGRLRTVMLSFTEQSLSKHVKRKS